MGLARGLGLFEFESFEFTSSLVPCQGRTAAKGGRSPRGLFGSGKELAARGLEIGDLGGAFWGFEIRDVFEEGRSEFVG